MNARWRISVASPAILVVLASVALAGCGSTSSSTSISDPAASEPSSHFLVPGKPNKIATFGEEGSNSEREAASVVLEQSLRARAAGNWARQCSTLAAGVVRGIKKRASFLGIEKGCSKDLEAEAEPAPKSIRANTLAGPIDALRVEGIRAFALYHGKQGVNYAMPMRREGGVWKVASEVTTELPSR